MIDRDWCLCTVIEREPPVLHLVLDDSTASHILLYEITGHLELAVNALI